MCMQVQTVLRTDTEYLKRLAFSLKLERIPEMSSQLRERMKCLTETVARAQPTAHKSLIPWNLVTGMV